MTFNDSGVRNKSKKEKSHFYKTLDNTVKCENLTVFHFDLAWLLFFAQDVVTKCPIFYCPVAILVG